MAHQTDFLNPLMRLRVLTLLALLLLQIALILIAADKGFSFLIITLCMTALFIMTFLSVERMYFLFAFYVVIAPAPVYIDYFPGIPVYYALRFVIPMFSLLILYWIFYLLGNKEESRCELLDYAILFYLFLTAFAALLGFVRGNSFAYVVNDLVPHLFYLGYFIFLYSPLRLHPERFFHIILIFSIAVSIEFLYGFSQTEGLIFFRRIVARGIHLAPFAIAYIGATFIYGKQKNRKLLFALLLPIVLFAVFVSQQRSLWVSTITVIIILLVMFLYSKRQIILRYIKRIFVISTITVITALTAISVFIASSLRLFVLSRLLVFLNPRLFSYDISWWTRKTEIALALKDFPRQFLFGSGFGATIVSPIRHFVLFAPDNAYAYLLWKMGIIGLLSFVAIQYLFVNKCFVILRRAQEPSDRILALTGLLNMLGLMIIGFANACISQYELLIIWTAIIAAIEITARKYK